MMVCQWETQLKVIPLPQSGQGENHLRRPMPFFGQAGCRPQLLVATLPQGEVPLPPSLQSPTQVVELPRAFQPGILFKLLQEERVRLESLM